MLLVIQAINSFWMKITITILPLLPLKITITKLLIFLPFSHLKAFLLGNGGDIAP